MAPACGGIPNCGVTPIPIPIDIDANSLWIGVGIGFVLGVLFSVAVVGAVHWLRFTYKNRKAEKTHKQP